MQLIIYWLNQTVLIFNFNLSSSSLKLITDNYTGWCDTSMWLEGYGSHMIYVCMQIVNQLTEWQKQQNHNHFIDK